MFGKLPRSLAQDIAHSPRPRPPLWPRYRDASKAWPLRIPRSAVRRAAPGVACRWCGPSRGWTGERSPGWPQLPESSRRGLKKTSKILTFPPLTRTYILLLLSFVFLCLFLLQYQTQYWVYWLALFGWPFILNVLEYNQPCRIAVITFTWISYA